IGALVLQVLAFGVAVATIPGEALSGPMGWLTWLRLVVGTLLPIGIAVLAILASRAASLQASTGLLYIALALVMAGSIAGASITDGRIDERELMADLGDITHGAVVTFVGRARNRSDEGREVLELEYEAYRPMAERVLAEIADDASARCGASVGIVHRVGIVP